MKYILCAVFIAALLFGQEAETINQAQCGELPCQWVFFPAHQAGLAPYDQIHIYTSTAESRVRAFLVTVEYRWQGVSSTVEAVALRQKNGVGMLTLYFNDIREVRIDGITVEMLQTKRSAR